MATLPGCPLRPYTEKWFAPRRTAARQDDKLGEDRIVLFNVAQLIQEPTGSERHYQIADTMRDVSDEGETTVSGAVRLVRTNRGILAYASVDAVVPDLCSRCLGPAEVAIHTDLAEEFIPAVDVHTGQPIAAPEDDADGDTFRIDEHHHLDLTEALRQVLVAEEPMRALCRPDCAGLCATCGSDLNLGRCACPREGTDDRWAALRSLQLSEN